MNMNEIKELDEKSAWKKIQELERMLFQLNFSKNTSGIEKPHELKNARKTIARIKTKLNMKAQG